MINNNTKDQDITDFNFSSDIFKVFVFKKLCRISQAVYMGTMHMKDREDLKDRLRALSLDVISLSVNFNENTEVKNSFVLYKQLTRQLMLMASILEVAWLGGLIGETNFNLIRNEIHNLSLNIKDRTDQGNNINVLRPGFFQVSEQIKRTDKGHEKRIKDNLPLNNSKGQSKEIIETIDFKDSFNIKNNLEKKEFDIDIKKNVLNKDFKSFVLKRDEREKKILSFFSPGVKLTIKDITSLSPDYGEKTIQRELARLVDYGKLKKEGEKRWTMYFLP